MPKDYAWLSLSMVLIIRSRQKLGQEIAGSVLVCLSGSQISVVVSAFGMDLSAADCSSFWSGEPALLDGAAWW